MGSSTQSAVPTWRDAAPDKHVIFEGECEAGNMGTRFQAWRAFCSCGWCMEHRTADRVEYRRQVEQHLSEDRRNG